MDSNLPALRHMPTLTLDRAVALVDKTRYGGSEADREWLLKLLKYSAEHGKRFVEAVDEPVREESIAGPGPVEEQDGEENLHPLLSNGQVFALIVAQRAFRAACDTFVEYDQCNDELRKPVLEMELDCADLEAAVAALDLIKAVR